MISTRFAPYVDEGLGLADFVLLDLAFARQLICASGRELAAAEGV
jgi:hypothetical protein